MSAVENGSTDLFGSSSDGIGELRVAICRWENSKGDALTPQKSVVILTHLPFPKLFARVLDHVAPSFFNYGYSALEVACHAFASWPDPTPDTTLTLPLLSNVIEAKLPDKINSPQVAPNIDTVGSCVTPID